MLAPLNNSVVFKKLFREPEILTAFVKDLVAVDLSIDDMTGLSIDEVEDLFE